MYLDAAMILDGLVMVSMYAIQRTCFGRHGSLIRTMALFAGPWIELLRISSNLHKFDPPSEEAGGQALHHWASCAVYSTRRGGKKTTGALIINKTLPKIVLTSVDVSSTSTT